MITETGTLPIGVDIDGQRYRDFVVRPAIVRDSVEAIEEVGPNASQLRLTVAIMARQASFPGLDQATITTDLIMGMHDADFAVLDAAVQRVEKKVRTLSEN